MLRILAPVPISFNEAIGIAAVGLVVNLLSAWMLRDTHDHDEHEHHHHGHHHDHHGGHDHNLRAAYIHVLADALTSVLAIVGLLTARFYGWLWVDPAVGIIGAGVIALWALGLIRSSGSVLLDMMPNRALQAEIRDRLEAQGDKVSDLHLWQVGPGHTAVIASVVSNEPQAAAIYKARLDGLPGLSHVTMEVHACPDHRSVSAAA